MKKLIAVIPMNRATLLSFLDALDAGFAVEVAKAVAPPDPALIENLKKFMQPEEDERDLESTACGAGHHTFCMGCGCACHKRNRRRASR